MTRTSLPVAPSTATLAEIVDEVADSIERRAVSLPAGPIRDGLLADVDALRVAVADALGT